MHVIGICRKIQLFYSYVLHPAREHDCSTATYVYCTLTRPKVRTVRTVLYTETLLFASCKVAPDPDPDHRRPLPYGACVAVEKTSEEKSEQATCISSSQCRPAAMISLSTAAVALKGPSRHHHLRVRFRARSSGSRALPGIILSLQLV